ncbi:MAG TPA: caspase family protein [Roseiarcus sp.]|nr:caspase family protein [Roseiarcus sp.]
MGRRLSLFLLFLTVQVALLAQFSPSYADKRVALVIGNAHYKNTPALANPTNDAGDVAQALSAIGFDVTLKIDAGKREIDQALAQFARDSSHADAALFYYAGHGMQYHGRNFLMPVDAELQDEISIRYELASLDDVKEALQRSNGVKIMILDACRNNPLADKFVRSITISTRDIPKVQGYARPEQTRGMIIVYATQADDVAHDGTGRNSPFSSAFLKEVKEPGLEIGAMFRRVNADVNAATDGQQSPEISISLTSEYYLNQGETDQQIWARIRTSPDAGAIREFLDRYPNSFYAPDAAARLELLEREAREKEAVAQSPKQTQQTAAAEADRLKQERQERERIAAEARAQEQDLATKLAAAEAARQKLAAELSARETAQAEADARERADREKAERERQEREAELRRQIAEMQASQAEKDRLTQDSIEKERAKQAAADQVAADRQKTEKENADLLKADAARAQELKQQVAQLEQQAADARAKAAAEEQKATQANQAVVTAEQKVALATTGPAVAAPGLSAAQTDLVPQIRSELLRLGCYSGGEAEWAGAEMKRSLAKYALYAKLDPPPQTPSTDLLDDMKGRRDRLCPPDCSAHEVSIGGRCVAKACGHGEILNRQGQCVAKPAPKEVATRAAGPAKPAAGGHCFVFNGNQYCE